MNAVPVVWVGGQVPPNVHSPPHALTGRRG